MKIRYLVDTTIRKPGLSDVQARQLRLAKAPQSEYRSAVKKGDIREVDEAEARAVIATGVAAAADEVAGQIKPPTQEQIAAQAAANVGMGAAEPGLNVSSPEFHNEANAAQQARLPSGADEPAKSLTESLAALTS